MINASDVDRELVVCSKEYQDMSGGIAEKLRFAGLQAWNRTGAYNTHLHLLVPDYTFYRYL